VFISDDNGENFNKINTLPILNYTSVSMDSNGKNIFISCNSFIDTLNMDTFINSTNVVIPDNLKSNSSYLYFSNNFGKNWNKDYSTDLIYKFDKILISNDYKNIIGIGYYNISYQIDKNISYFINTSVYNNNYKIIGMLVSGVDNEYYENTCMAISLSIMQSVIWNVYTNYLQLDDNTKNDINLFTKYIVAGLPKIYTGLQYTHFKHSDLLINNSLINIFNNNKIMGGLWINNFIKGYNFVTNEFLYNILEKEKKDSIMIQNPFMNTKLWKIFHKDLSSKYPILLTKIIYFNFWIKQYLLLEIGRFNTTNLDTQYDYYDINSNITSSIKYNKSEYFSSQRSISDFIYYYFNDIFNQIDENRSVFKDFVIEYIYFDINKQTWTIGSEKVSPFIKDDRELSILFPILLYGYEKPYTLYEFSGK
jgi:hypothetical protein